VEVLVFACFFDRATQRCRPICGAILAWALAGSAWSSGLARFDSATGIASLPEVIVGSQRYEVELRLQADGRFAVQAARPGSAGVAAAPAVYDASTGRLSIPKIAVAGQTYAATLRDVGGLRFELTESSAVSAVSNLTQWTQTGFRASAPTQPKHVNRVLVSPTGRVHAAWVSQDNRAYMASTDNQGANWTHKALDQLQQIHQLIRLDNGTLVAGGQAFGQARRLWLSTDDGASWRSGGAGLPNASSDIVWDLAERNGEVIVSTSSTANAATGSHVVVYAWNPQTDALRPLAPLPGIGTLALTVTRDGRIYAATQASAEHDDPAKAGQAEVYRSDDGGASWVATGLLSGANRVYALAELSDGSLVAGTGLNGGFYRSVDGRTWVAGAQLLPGSRLFGSPPVMTAFPVTRVYKFLELSSGALLAGTGNDNGDIQLSCDRGASWLATAETGNNIVTWGLAQAADGTIWVGNGSLQGDVWKASPPAGVPAAHHFSCA